MTYICNNINATVHRLVQQYMSKDVFALLRTG